MRDYKIPKNLNQKDTIGNFTFPQLAILGGGLLIILALFGSGINIFLAIVLSLPIAFLIYVLMYVKRMDMPIYEYALVYLSFVATPKRMIYRKENKRKLLSIQEQIFIIEEEEENGKEETIDISGVKKNKRKEKVQKERVEKETTKKEKNKKTEVKQEKPKGQITKKGKTSHSNLKANNKNKTSEDLNFKL